MESTPEQSNPFYYKLVESRATILEMMEARGYDITPYSRIPPQDLIRLSSNPDALQMILKHKDDDTRKAYIFYPDKPIKSSLTNTIKKIVELIQEKHLSPESEFIYIITKELVNKVDGFHEAVAKNWSTSKLRLQFFEMNDLVSNPLKHFLQPKFEVVPAESHDEILKTLYARTKTQLPIMRYHVDMVSRVMGLLPGTIVKITRPSPSAGSYQSYRIVAL
jgi:DNA-directed RNA polymerase subunit H (RpoH/RPB5)